MAQSCIIKHFQDFAELTRPEIELLRTLERDQRSYAAGETLRASGDPAAVFFTLTDGWACASRCLADGERQVMDLFLPGQVMGLREIGYDHALSDFVAITDIQACPFPKARLTEVFDSAPRLADLFMLTLARDQSILLERVVNLGRRSAEERVAHFLVEMKTRVAPDAPSFQLRMKQGVIGDALGLSAVHVSRTLRALSDRGLISKTGKTVRIDDLQALIEFSDFNPTYLQRNVRWARQSAAEGAEALAVNR